MLEVIIIAFLLFVAFLLYLIIKKLNRLSNICSNQGNKPVDTTCRYFHSTNKRHALSPHQKALKAWQDKGKEL